MEPHPGQHEGAITDPAGSSLEGSQVAANQNSREERQETAGPEREITYDKLHAMYLARGEKDTPELRAFIQCEVENEDRLWRENPELAARRDQHRREFMSIVDEHYQSHEE